MSRLQRFVRGQLGKQMRVEEGKTAEELERETDTTDADDEGPTALDRVQEEAEPLTEGSAIDTPAGPLPRRALLAIGVALAVAVVAYLILWAVLGGLGLLLGWLPAAALGALAGREAARRA